jgi:hypothetical protein
MRLFALLRWELVQNARGLAPHATATIVSFGSAALVGAGIIVLSLWSPFPTATVSNGFRTDTSNTPALLPILGEFRGGIAFGVLLAWLLLIATAVGPALAVGTLVRDRQTGRLDRILSDASRADVVAVAKLLAALIPLTLILLTAGPSMSFAWLVGGLASRAALASVGVLLVAIVLIAAIGLFCSAIAGTEVAAILASYLLVASFLFGPLVLGLGLAAAGLRSVGNVVVALDPFVALFSGQPELASKLSDLIPSEWPVPPLTWVVADQTVPVWFVSVLVYAIVAAALVWLTSVLLEPLHPVKTWRLRQARSVGRLP